MYKRIELLENPHCRRRRRSTTMSRGSRHGGLPGKDVGGEEEETWKGREGGIMLVVVLYQLTE